MLGRVSEIPASTVVLGDGTSALLRPIAPADAAALQQFRRRPSPESRYLRHFPAKPELFARALEQIGEAGFWRIGLAGDAGGDLKDSLGPPRVAPGPPRGLRGLPPGPPAGP